MSASVLPAPRTTRADVSRGEARRCDPPHYRTVEGPLGSAGMAHAGQEIHGQDGFRFVLVRTAALSIADLLVAFSDEIRITGI